MGTESDAIVTAIKAMSDAFIGRIQNTETQFSNHASKVEDKMEQLVDLTKHMAVMNERNDNIHADITELKTLVRENHTASNNSTERLHKRIDDALALVDTKIGAEVTKLKGDLAASELKRQALDDKFHRVYYTGTGMWLLFVLVSGTLGWGLQKGLDAIDREKSEIQANIKRIDAETRAVDDSLRAFKGKVNAP